MLSQSVEPGKRDMKENAAAPGSAAKPDAEGSALEPSMPQLKADDDNFSSWQPQPQPPTSEDDYFYGDQDDAQSFIQPAISPIATRLSSPWTPAEERARAMDEVVDGAMFDSIMSDASTEPPSQPPGPSGPNKLTKSRDRGATTGHISVPSESQLSDFPSPWQAGPREFVIRDSSTGKLGIPGVFGGQSRHSRSSSVGADALRKLSRAFPSISIPSGLLPSLTTPSFFSSTSSQRTGSHVPTPSTVTASPIQHPSPPDRGPPALSRPPLPIRPGLHRTSSIASRRSQALRKSTSDDSLLYHSLSRVSSFGDDDRFQNIRDQVNSRFKAIRDSFPDVPAFKLPQLPNLFPTPSKTSLNAPEVSRSTSKTVSIGRDPSSILDTVLESLTGDIVLLGGYRGSILRDAKPPYRQVWIPVKVGLNIRKVNMEVGLDSEDEEQMENSIFASGMLQNIGPVDIAKRLFKKLRECDNARKGKLRIHDYGYDWRLSPHLLSQRLIDFLEKLPCNHPRTPKEERGALVIAHSLGGLLTRHAVNIRPELFSGVIYAGAPQRCVNILGPIRNGDAVLLNEKVLTAPVNFSLRTTFIFLPEDGSCFINKDTKEEYPVDFYDVNDWIKYRWSPCIDPPLGPYIKRPSALGSLLDLSASLPSLPLRGRSGSESKKAHSPPRSAAVPDAALRRAEIAKDRTLAPQMDSSSSSHHPLTGLAASDPAALSPQLSPLGPQSPQRAKALAYLTRTLAEVKRFRAEMAHVPAHTEVNAYPPLAVIYGKDIPTVYAARVACREAIACADAYDNLAFQSGDGVVLAREAMLPPGYDLVRGGRVSTDRGHVTLLGDMAAVGRALEAVVKGRRKGIGLGTEAVAKGAGSSA